MENRQKTKDLILGFLIGIVTTTVGSFLFIKLVLQNDFNQGLQFVKDEGYLGKIITLGAILNIIVFFILLKYNKEIVARGVVLATIVLALVTMFV
jgi:hypothetical protein